MEKYEVYILGEALALLRGLPRKLRAKAYRSIELLEDFGPRLGMPHAKALRGMEGLHELRVKQANNIARLFYFHDKGRVYVITSGFIKKSDKTDARELNRAVSLMNSYKERNQ